MNDVIQIIVIFIVILMLFYIVIKNMQIQKNIEETINNKINENIKDQEYMFERFESNIDLKMKNNLLQNQTSMIKDINEFKDNLTKNLNEDFTNLNNIIEKRLDNLNYKVEERLDKGFEKTTKTFNNILERLTKIDEAQKKIELLSNNIVSLQDVLTDKKTRGVFGEVQLNQILFSIFGEKNEKLFQLQYKYSNGYIVDAVVMAPEPMGTISIDSKFPLENFRRMLDKNILEEERKRHEKQFVADLKKHIDDISNKYIIKGETADQAILFLPAEAIFAEINAYYQNIVDYAQNKNVWIASPTTLMAVLTTVQVLIMNIERDKYAYVIQEELEKLSVEFGRYKERWTRLTKDIEKVQKDVNDISITSDKIESKFIQISKVEIEEESKKLIE